MTATHSATQSRAEHRRVARRVFARRVFARRSAALALVLPLSAALAACGAQSDSPDEVNSTSSSTVTSTKSTSSASPSSSGPKPTGTESSPDHEEHTPEPTLAAEPDRNVGAGRPDKERNTGGEIKPEPQQAQANCVNRTAPPINNTSIPIVGGGNFRFEPVSNRYDPCEQMSWIHVTGEHHGKRDAVLLYHYGDPVNSPQPPLIPQVTGVQRLDSATVKVSYPDGHITYRVTVDGVKVMENTINAATHANAPRLVGAHT